MKVVKLEEIKATLTEEQKQAIEKCHNAYFYAEMSDDFGTTIREKQEALEELKKHFKNLVGFSGDFYNGNDTLRFNEE